MISRLLFIAILIMLNIPLTAPGQISAGPSPAAIPKIRGIHEAMQKFIDAGDISGAITLVATKDEILHFDAIGLANIETRLPMRTESQFWIGSMTEPVTGVTMLMLQDMGKLKITDPISKYIPAFSNLKTPAGKPANLTIKQILTHTSGLGEASEEDILKAKNLSDLVFLYLAAPMQYEPGAQWRYTQSGINVAAHIAEIASKLRFDYLVKRLLFDPLGMANTAFYPGKLPYVQRVIGYSKNKRTGKLEPTALPPINSGKENLPPLGNGGLFSTGPDYGLFCQMLLGNGVYNGKRYLSNEAMKLLTTIQTGNVPSGFIKNHGADYGWGIGLCIQRRPHDGVGSMLSRGTFGQGGAWGTQAWMDPVRGVVYLLLVQRPEANSYESEIRSVFQQIAANALTQNN
jgi:CubicO group peptidase (beta-lactamase class C family)